MVGQNPLAQPMQGGNRRHIEFDQRHLKFLGIGLLLIRIVLPRVCSQSSSSASESGGKCLRPEA